MPEWMGTALLIAGGLFVALIIYGAWYSTTPEGKAAEAEKKRKSEDMRTRFEDIFTNQGFPQQPRYVGRCGAISLDPVSKRIAIQIPAKWPLHFLLQEDSRSIIVCHDRWEVFGPDQIVGAELFFDEERVLHTSGGKSLIGAAVGAAVGGGVGAMVGARGGPTKTTETVQVRSIKLRVLVKDFNSPWRDVEFLDSFGRVSTKFGPGAKAIETAQGWLRRVELCMGAS